MSTARFCLSSHPLGFCSVTPPATSGRNQFKPGGSQTLFFLCFPGQDGESFPDVTPCCGFPVMVCLLAVTESPRQGGRRTQAQGGQARAARKAAHDCQGTKSFVLTSRVLP